MVRQRYYHDPSRKHFEAFNDFSGGMNSTSSNDNVKDNEVVYLQNMDLGERGSLKRRKGFKSIENIDAEGFAQGIFRHYRNHTPYNLLGLEGSLDGIRKRSGSHVSIGEWYVFNMPDESNAYKMEREKSKELIVNGDFEDGENGWDLNIDNRYGDSLIGESIYAYSGTSVMRIRRYRGSTGHYNEYQDWDKEIPTREGEEIYAEAMYRAAARSIGQPPYRIHLIASVLKEDGTRERFYINRYDVDDTWKKVYGYFKMPKGAVSVIFGVGIIDNGATDADVAAYFDAFYARREEAGTLNSAVALRSTAEDTARNRGIGLRFTGLKPNAYYIMLADYKSDGVGTGRLAVRDERFGTYPDDNGLVIGKNINSTPTEWTTQYMKFQTYSGMEQGRAYVYNYSPLGTLSTVFYDQVRIYEVTPEEYEKIDRDPEYTGEALAEKFPYRTGTLYSENYAETITVVGGKFYVDGKPFEVEGGIPIQSDRPMEAVSFKNNLYIASGSGLLVYNGSTIAPVTPYDPDPLETLYIGTNGLATTGFGISDGESPAVSVKDVMFSRRYGLINEFITVSATANKPANMTLEYKFERRNVNDKRDYWFTMRDWDTDSDAAFITDIAGEYQFRVSVREKGTELVLADYKIPKYIIKSTEDDEDIPIDSNTLHTCNRILLHWDRLILYGDLDKPNIIYVSHLNVPNYFPNTNTLLFENPRNERITSIVPYRDNLVVFTKTSIQALYGTNPQDFRRVMLNTSVGCIADRGAEVVKNHIIFPSYEGISLLRSVGMSETRSNVEVLDMKIKEHVEDAENAVAYLRNNQYCILYPDSNKLLRYYYEWDVWAMDESPSLDFTDAIIEDNKIYALGSDGRIVLDADDFADDGVPFVSKMITKHHFFGEPYAIKKTKELQIMFNPLEQDTKINVEVTLDTGIVASQEIDVHVDEDVYKLQIAGKGLNVSMMFEHKENKPFTLVGFGLIFKLKKP